MYISSIYCIENLLSNKVYVGSSKNTKRRWNKHKNDLKKLTHHNLHLQNSWNKNGEDAFVFYTLEEDVPNNLLFEREAFWTELIEPEYNIGGICGGDNLTRNPNREGIIARISSTMKCRHAEEGNPWQDRDVKGSLNPNWRGGSIEKHTTCLCGNTKEYSAKVCHSCHDRSGDKNPFYGKNHTEATKEKIRVANTGKAAVNPTTVVIEGVEYESFTEAGRKLDIGTPLVFYRCTKSLNKKFKDWCVKGVEKVYEEPKRRGNVILCEGVKYYSLQDAADFYKLSTTAIRNRLTSENYPEFLKS